MKSKGLLDKTVFAIALVGCIVLLNVLALNAFVRVDLTRDGQFTLSEASRDTVGNLEDRLTVRAYFSEDLPPPYANNARFVKDLLDEYFAASKGNLGYEFLDPVAEESNEDKEARKEVRRDVFGRQIRQQTSVERELSSLGIQPVEVRVSEGDRLEVKRVYMGISLRYGDQREVIPVVADISSLEYDLTSLMRKITRTSVPSIALVTGREGLDLQEDLSSVMALLSQQYEVKPLDLATDAAALDEADAVVVTGPKTQFEQAEIDALDAFVRSGRSAAFLLDSVKVDLRTTEYEPALHGLDSLLAGYGVRIRPGLLLDAECAQINVMQQRGPMRIQQPVAYPYLPLVGQPNQEHPLTRGLSEISFPFVSGLEVTLSEDSPVTAEALVTSSGRSWLQSEPLNLNPMQRWPATIEFTGPYPMIVALSGPIGQAAGGAEGGDSGRVLVAGGSSLIQNQFLAGSGQALVLNLVDWLLMDEGMMEIRSRGMADAPLDEISDGKRNFVKYGNIVGVPLAFIVFGLMRWRLRERRRALVEI